MPNPFKDYIKYLKDNPQGFWFKRKLYGWGWTPAKWQGWLVISIYILFVIFFSFSIDKNTTPNQFPSDFFIPFIALTLLLILIIYRTGEKPGWRWGSREEDEKK